MACVRAAEEGAAGPRVPLLAGAAPSRGAHGKDAAYAESAELADTGGSPSLRAWVGPGQAGQKAVVGAAAPKTLWVGPGGEVIGPGGEVAEGGDPCAGLPELTLGQCLRNGGFWLLWSTFFTGMGAGFCFLNNLAQVPAPAPIMCDSFEANCYGNAYELLV